MIHLPLIPSPNEVTSAGAARRYTTVHFGAGSGGGASIEYPPAQEPPWWKQPNSPEDAAGFVIGARSGLKIPAHDIAYGPYGPDSKDFVRKGWPAVNRVEGGEWPF